MSFALSPGFREPSPEASSPQDIADRLDDFLLVFYNYNRINNFYRYGSKQQLA